MAKAIRTIVLNTDSLLPIHNIDMNSPTIQRQAIIKRNMLSKIPVIFIAKE